MRHEQLFRSQLVSAMPKRTPVNREELREKREARGTAAVFNFSRANSLPHHCVREKTIVHSLPQALKWTVPHSRTKTLSQRHRHKQTHLVIEWTESDVHHRQTHKERI